MIKTKNFSGMNCLLFLSAILFIPIIVFGDVAVNSPIAKDTLWSAKDSPYIIEKDLTIEKNAKLTIEPGVTVSFKANPGGVKAKLIVLGVLNAIGKEGNLINFTSESLKSGSWGGIIFEKDSIGTVEYCKIQFAASGISCFSSSPSISHNSFEINEVALVCEDHASPTISNNYLTQNGTFQSATGGIACSLHSSPKIDQNIIEKNIGYGIYISTFSTPRITNNKIADNKGRGIVIFSGSSPVVVNNEIARNSCSCGIIVYQSSATILDNNIYENRAHGIGVTLAGTTLIQNNYIHGNGNGILINAASPMLAYNTIKDNKGGGITIWDDSEPVINFNHIDINEGIPSIRIGRITNPINLANNWWGTTDKALIEKNIVNLADKGPVSEKVNLSNLQEKEIPLQLSLNQKINISFDLDLVKNIPWNIHEDKILFVSFRENNWDICMTNKEGTINKNLTNNNLHDVYPIFSADGRNVLYSSRRNGSLDICVMNLDNNTSTQITDTISNEEFPTWSPDGTQIAFKQVENLEDYYVINTNGSNRTRFDSAPLGYHNVLFMWMPVNGKLALK